MMQVTHSLSLFLSLTLFSLLSSLFSQGGGAPRPGQAARRAIDAACQSGDSEAAFAAFDAAVADGEPLQPHTCNVLLHLCSGGTTGGSFDGSEANAAAKVIVPSLDAVHPERANTIFNYMIANDVPRTEMSYTALARIEAARGEPRKAFDLVKRLVEERLQPKLRTFAPALHAFAAAGDLAGATEVDNAITTAKIDITEAEYGVMLAAYRQAGRWDDAFNLLRRLREDIRTLGEPMADEVRRLFDAAPGWKAEASVSVDENSGACEASPSGRRIQLAAIHLSPKDRADLLAGIGKLAREREAESNFDNFARWLERKGPIPFLVDGANVGMYNQNFQQSKFAFNQVERVMTELRPAAKQIHEGRMARFGKGKGGAGAGGAGGGEKNNSGIIKSGGEHADAGEAAAATKKTEEEAGREGKKSEESGGTVTTATTATAAPVEDDKEKEKKTLSFNPLPVDAVGASMPVNFLHVRRVRGGPANHHVAQRCINGWKSSGELFTTPSGSNDDWYWLYAAVASGDDSFLVSNDEMRDHVFQMLPAPKLFQRWKERHQVRFHMSAATGLEFYYPPVFTTCVQEAGDKSWWMFPLDSGEWLCGLRRECE